MCIYKDYSRRSTQKVGWMRHKRADGKWLNIYFIIGRSPRDCVPVAVVQNTTLRWKDGAAIRVDAMQCTTGLLNATKCVYKIQVQFQSDHEWKKIKSAMLFELSLTSWISDDVRLRAQSIRHRDPLLGQTPHLQFFLWGAHYACHSSWLPVS